MSYLYDDTQSAPNALRTEFHRDWDWGPLPMTRDRQGWGANGQDDGHAIDVHAWSGSIEGPYVGKGPKGYRRSDDRIREEACEWISRQGVVDASEVEVSAEGGVLRLTGHVATRRDKRWLETFLDRVVGVEDIRNELRTVPRDWHTERYQGRGERHMSSSQNGKNARA